MYYYTHEIAQFSSVYGRMWKKIGLKMLIHHGGSTKCRVEDGDDEVGVARGGILNFVYFVYLPSPVTNICIKYGYTQVVCFVALGTICTILGYFMCNRNR